MKLLPRFWILLPFSLLLFTGCGTLMPSSAPYSSGMHDAGLYIPGMYPEASIVVQMKDNSVMTFQDGWGLTWSGVNGTAEIHTGGETRIVPDTTISYWDINDASSARRDNTTRQFLLTILGVILVIGLAAIILYAAFIATDR